MIGKLWAWLGIAVGMGISVYANIAEKYTIFDAASKRWIELPDPKLDGVILAAAAPVVLFLMSELFGLVRGSGLAAWVVRISTAVVAGVAFVASFQHLHGLLLARGESELTAWIYPLGIDGLMVGATAVLWQIRDQDSRPSADLGTLVGAEEARPEAADRVVGTPSQPATQVSPTAPNPAPKKPAAARRRIARTAEIPDVLNRAAKTAAATIEARGENLTRDRLRDQLRTDGHACSNDRAGHLLNALKAA